MPVGWAITVVALCVAVVILAVVLLGLLRQVIPVLERAAGNAVPDALIMGPPVGSRLPHLPSIRADGKIVGEQLQGDRPAVLLFLTPGCGPCRLLAEEMNRVDLGGLTGNLLIITSPGGPQELGIPPGLAVLTELDRELSDPLSVNGTPFAIAVGPGGIITDKRVPNTMKQVVDLVSTIA
jgi:hypothetical protein